MSKSKIIHGTFTSVWDNGSEISTQATLDLKTGELECTSSRVDPDGCLEREYFEDSDYNEYEVCKVCHSYIMKGVVNPDDTGCGLHDDEECSDPDCDSHNE